MKKDIEILEKNLMYNIEKIKNKKKIVEEINKELNQFNVPHGTFQAIARGSKPLNSLDSLFLCLVATAVHNQTKDNSIAPNEFFTERHIENAKKYQGNINSKITLPYVLNEVVQIDLDNYITKIKMSSLVEMFHSHLIVYDYETQRSAKYVKSKDGVIPIPDVNKKSVQDISEHMINETYLADMITLNIYSKEVEPLSFNEKGRSLVINDGAVISILDGFHRLQAGVRAVALNPDLELEMILSIRSYDTETAKKYFGQINTVNVIKQERLKELKSERYSDVVVRDLQKKSDLKGKIASASRISDIAGQLTTFDVLSYAVDVVYKPGTTLEAKEVSQYLIDFFNYLVGYYVDEFLINPNLYRKNYINHPLIFAGYVQLSKTMQEKNVELKSLKEVIQNINFKDNKLIELLEDRKGINNKRNRNRLIDYFRTEGVNFV